MKHSIQLMTAALIMACMFSGCEASNEDIGETVKQSMQETLASDPDFSSYGLKVTNVTVMHLGSNQYQGMADVVYRGHTRQIGISIFYDGANVMWEAPPGSFMFLFEDY